MDFTAEQTSLQPPADATDVLSVIDGVIEAEAAASRKDLAGANRLLRPPVGR